MAGSRRKKPEWKLVEQFDVTEYRCGLRAGDLLRLRSDLVIRDHLGNPTGKVHLGGEVWQVLYGSSDDPEIVFLLTPEGEKHFWSNDQSVYETFELADREGKRDITDLG